MRKPVLILTLIAIAVASNAQRPMSIKMKNPVICYANDKDHPFEIAAPEVYRQWKKNPHARVKTTTIVVDYVNFPDDVNGIGPKACFQAAVDIWESILSDIGSAPQSIRIEARWTTLGANVLGSALYTSAYANFRGAQKLNVFYPVAMAEKMSGQELNDGAPDLFANFNSNFTWHLDPNTSPPAAPATATHDLTTVVLHEIGHGLGFAGTFTLSGTNGQFGLNGTSAPIIYDVPIENGSNQNLIESFPSPSPDLRPQLISANLFFDSHTSGGPKLYAPTTFNGGSSISHLDETTYNATSDALMTPQIATRERMHHPGNALNMLKDMGWENARINHQQFPGSEITTGSYPITTTIQADAIGYVASSVKLHYTHDGNFTEVVMTPTANANEFTANIPSTGSAADYAYFISVNDNAGREFVNPGKVVENNEPQQQNLFFFSTGPDTEDPIITHTPKGFILETDTQLAIEAKVIDNLGVESVKLEYYKNDDLIGSANMLLTTPEEDSIYLVTLSLPPLSLQADDQLKYRIIATDVAAIGNPNGNIGHSPSSSTFHSVNVVGLKPTQVSYQNNFNSVSDDFFGTGFTITTPSGFNDAAIHTTHPYQQGNGLVDNELNLIYQLKVPIRVKAEEATIKFDEIVLVEPGAAGSVFGSSNFFDYVVVEGSKDGGVTWTIVANGYDSRDNTDWLTRYNSVLVDDNSTAVGDPGLFKTRTLDLQQKFDTNDEVVLRFRLYSDQLATGWGWCIDNLKIQIDDNPPKVLNDHVDYLLEGSTALSVTTNATDASGVESLKVEFKINNGTLQHHEFDLSIPASSYTLNIDNSVPFALGDVIQYRIVATDGANNTGGFPVTGFIQVPVLNFGTTVNQYSNNFNTASDDFVGNFFTISQPSGFENGAVQTEHPYSNGVGLDLTSDFIYTLKKAIKVSPTNHYLRFDEIALIEGHPTGIVFGSPGFKDYVIVEGSKDGGQTWFELIDGYDNMSQSVWLTTFLSQGVGSPSLYRTRTIDLTESGDFVANDHVVIRFRLFADQTINGWGWAIDNLYIQDPVTGTEKELETSISVYPNPTSGDITIEFRGMSALNFTAQLMGSQGNALHQETITNETSHTIQTSHLPVGVYFLKISDGKRLTVKKVVKTR